MSERTNWRSIDTRLRNIAKEAGISLPELAALSNAKLLMLPNCGRLCIRRLRAMVKPPILPPFFWLGADAEEIDAA